LCAGAYDRDEQIIWLMEGLEFVGPPALNAIPTLLPLLQHRNPEVVFYVAGAIAAIDPMQPGITAPLVLALSSESRRRRFESMYRLQLMENCAAPAVPTLIELLDDPDYCERAAQVLGWIGPAASSAVPRLVKLMNASNESSTPIDSLSRIQHPDALPFLVAALDNERKREAVLRGFRWMKPLCGPAVEKMRTMLVGPFRVEVLKALGDLGEIAAPATPDLIALLNDGDQEVRIEAIHALGKLQAAGERLTELAQDEDSKIQEAALRSLGGPQPLEAIPLLLAHAASQDDTIARAAIQGLSGYGDKTPEMFVQLLLRRFDEGDEDMRWAVMYALERLGPNAAQAIPQIISLLAADEFYAQAFKVLEAIGPPAASALPELEGLLNSQRFRAYARDAIYKIAPDRDRDF